MRVYRALLVLLLAALLAGCGGGDGAESAKESGTEAAETGETETAAIGKPNTLSAAVAEIPETCPEKSEPRTLAVGLDGWETPETVGIFAGNARGYFAESGLKVATLATVGPQSVIPNVVLGADKLAVSHAPEVVLAREEGAPVVIFATLVTKPTAAMIWLKKSKIGGIADLKGKTIAYPGLSFQETFLERILAQGGLTLADVKLERVGNEMVADLTSGRADAIFGRSNLQGAELEARGLQPVVTPVRAFGIPAYDEIVLVARADCLAKQPQVFRDFLAAVKRGTAAAIQDTEGATGALLADPESNPETSLKAMIAQFEATLPLLSRDGRGNPGRVPGLVQWMHEEGLIQEEEPASALYTDDYLAQGP